jgi:hypothetical protein
LAQFEEIHLPLTLSGSDEAKGVITKTETERSRYITENRQDYR